MSLHIFAVPLTPALHWPEKVHTALCLQHVDKSDKLSSAMKLTFNWTVPKLAWIATALVSLASCLLGISYNLLSWPIALAFRQLSIPEKNSCSISTRDHLPSADKLQFTKSAGQTPFTLSLQLQQTDDLLAQSAAITKQAVEQADAITKQAVEQADAIIKQAVEQRNYTIEKLQQRRAQHHAAGRAKRLQLYIRNCAHWPLSSKYKRTTQVLDQTPGRKSHISKHQRRAHISKHQPGVSPKKQGWNL